MMRSVNLGRCAIRLGVAVSMMTLTMGCASRSESAFDAENSDFTPASLHDFRDYSVYTLGSEFDGEPLIAIHHRVGDPRSRAPVRADYVSLKYGTCESSSESGCPAPLEVQTWPACKRNRAMYQLAPDIDGDGPAKAVPYPREDLTVRGVPAAFFDQDSRLELYTGSVTVVLFGTGRNRLLSAAAALHGATEDVTAVKPARSLPSPSAGALQGKLGCL